jgi:mono/diheme cytochrome c family protein
MKSRRFVSAHAGMLAFASFTSLLPAMAVAADAKADADKARRGEYLVNTSGCHDCHTPMKMGKNGPEPDLANMLSGHPAALQMPPPPKLPEGPWLVVSSATNTAWSGPWGVSYTANLTPDQETGLGKWTLRDFIATFRTGRRMGKGREILPPMPIPAYQNFNDQDLEAIFAYLKTIPAVKNPVPEPAPPAMQAGAKK